MASNTDLSIVNSTFVTPPAATPSSPIEKTVSTTKATVANSFSSSQLPPEENEMSLPLVALSKEMQTLLDQLQQNPPTSPPASSSSSSGESSPSDSSIDNQSKSPETNPSPSELTLSDSQSILQQLTKELNDFEKRLDEHENQLDKCEKNSNSLPPPNSPSGNTPNSNSAPSASEPPQTPPDTSKPTDAKKPNKPAEPKKAPATRNWRSYVLTGLFLSVIAAGIYYFGVPSYARRMITRL